jgi:hypothetical protein
LGNNCELVKDDDGDERWWQDVAQPPDAFD